MSTVHEPTENTKDETKAAWFGALFEDDKLYSPTELEKKGIAKEQTLAQWRSNGKGPPYLKLGSRVGYPGAGAKRWAARRLVVPSSA